MNKIINFFLFISAICHVELCLFIIVCRIVMAHSFRQVSLMFSVI